MADDAGGGRGFSLSHQRVVLEVDFAGVLTGSAYLTIFPSNPSLRTVYLHASPLLQINSVTLSSPTPTNPLLPTRASFAHTNAFQPLPVREPPIDLKSHQEIKRKTWSALGEQEDGELAISVSHGWVRVQESEGAMSLAPILIQIDYQLVVGGSVVEGIVFRRPGDGGDESQIPHMFLSPTTFDSARVWTPCVDSLWERCTWELEFIVPRYLEGGEPRGDNEVFPVMVVASGELLEQVTHPHDPHKVIFYYMQTGDSSVQHISFAAGPFEVYQLPSETGGETQKPMLAFCLPGQRRDLINSTSFLCRAMTFYTTEYSSFPYSAYKMVFVSDPRAQATTAVTMSIFSSDLLHPADVIDQAFDTRQVLSFALIQQWIGVNIIQRTLSDTWLVTGLAGYIHGLFIRSLFGNNEYRFRMKKDIDRCVRLDNGEQLPLCVPGAIDPPSASAMAFMSLKGPLVLHILDRHIAKSGTSLGLSRVIPRIFLASLSDELQHNTVSTNYFFRLCRKVSSMDLTTFADQWIYGSGCPHITIKTNFIRKKFLVEFAVQQQQPAIQAAEAMEEKNKAKFIASKRPTPFFEGSLTVRIHEADGAPFEHLVDIKQPYKVFPLPFNTKYKRTRRSGHVAARFSKLQETLVQAEDNDDDQAEQLRDVDRSEVFAYPPWDDEEERRRWRVGDWSDDEASSMLGEGGGYEWIRVDPECEWLAFFDIQEKPWFWISQLQGDRDVVAQLQAIQRMTMYPSPVIASELARTVLVENYYYRVRMEAARALVVYNNSEADYIGLFLLLKLFQTLYCQPTDDEDPLSATAYPKPNDFANIASYFLKKSIVTALAELRDPATKGVWSQVRQLLLNVLKYNDNSATVYSDSYYVATVISALGSAFSAGVNLTGYISTDRDKELLKDATDAIERAITVDRLVPSYHNVVTQAGLQAHLKSILVGQRTNDPKIFLSYTREGNYEPLRIAAFDCLLLCKAPGRSQPLAQYLFDVTRQDYSLTVRRHVARAISESILMTLAVGEVYMASPPGVVEVNVDSPNQYHNEREQENTKIVKALRKEFNSKQELRQIVQQALLEAFTGGDHEILFALIKAAEVMSSSVPEPKPGVLITLQTPTTETPTGTKPKIRLSVGAPTPTTQRAEQADYNFPQVMSPEVATASTPIKIVLNAAAQAPPKEKKRKNVPKAQSKGLSDSDFKAVSIVLQKITADRRSHFFRHPVDPIRDDAPDYLKIVKTPIDLATIRAKFDGGMYSTRDEFNEDVKLLISNCFLYNAHGSPVRKAGDSFAKMYETLWKKTEATLKASAAGQAAPAQAPPPSAAPVPAARPHLTVKTSATSESHLMPPPSSVPGSAGGVPKIKLKSTKSVTIESPTSAMPPPPLPVSKKSSLAGSSAARSASPEKPPRKEKDKEKERDRDRPKEKPKDKPAKKKRDSAALDDLLGAEVDAMGRDEAADAIEDLLGESPPPPPKKIKLSASSGSSKSSQHNGSESAGSSKKGSAGPETPKIKLSATSETPKIKLSSGESSKKNSESSKAKPAEPPFKAKLWNDQPKAKATSADASRESSKPRSFGESSSSSSKPRSSGESSKTKPDAPTIRFDKPKSSDSTKKSSASPAPAPAPVVAPPPPPQPAAAAPVAGQYYAAPQWPRPPADLPATTTNTMPFRQKRAKVMIQVLIKDPNAGYFLRPVDPVRDGCPTYYQEIAHPSDYQTVTKAIDQKRYTTMGQLARDIELIFANCRQFNPPGPITDMAGANEALYWREWAKAVSPRMTPDEKKAMVSLVNRAFKEPLSFIFRDPVDPVALGIPQYFEIIPREDARDLTLIKHKLEKGSYQTARQVDEDFELMLENCRMFNGEGQIMDLANQFSAWWKQQRSKIDV